MSSPYPHPLQAGTHRRRTYRCFHSHHTWVQRIIALSIKPVLSMPLSQGTHWTGSKAETNCDCCIWGSDPTPCLMNRTHGETITEPFVLANRILIWLGILQTSSFMAASNQDSLMRDNKRLTDALINENLVYYFSCDMPCFGIGKSWHLRLAAELETLKIPPQMAKINITGLCEG